MENIVKLAQAEDIHKFVKGLWRTDTIRESHENGGLVKDIVDRFARQPKIFYEATDIDSEAPHFSPWWGAILKRDYDNDVVHDLYYLHEIEHAGTMPYIAGANSVTHKNKIRDNEHQASALSEMTIYFEFPELRVRSFPHPIFVDRFLFPDGDYNHADVRMLERWKREPDVVTQEMMYERANVLTTKNVPIDDLAAYWLKRFYAQGRSWCEIWNDRYDQVERGMINFRNNCAEHGRKVALDKHVEWLLSDEIAEGTAIPFYSEAVAFGEVYRKHKAEYFDAIDKHKLQAVTHKGGPASKPPTLGVK